MRTNQIDKIRLRMRALGYSLYEYGNGLFALRSLPINGYRFPDPPNKFTSATGAADYLVSITQDDQLREMISGL